MAAQEDDLAGARKYYETALKHHPDDLGTIIQLALIDGREGNSELFVSRLQEASNEHPNAVESRIILGQY